MLTTFGFVHFEKRQVRLAAIRYMQPWAAFIAPPQERIEIMGWTVPVIIRPWLPTVHYGPAQLDGNCWVKFLDKGGRENRTDLSK